VCVTHMRVCERVCVTALAMVYIMNMSKEHHNKEVSGI
jgi:hypothetical protein